MGGDEANAMVDYPICDPSKVKPSASCMAEAVQNFSVKPVSIVTGCNGKLGAMVCEHLRSIGHVVVGIDRSGNGLNANCTDEKEVDAVMCQALTASCGAQECYLVNVLGYTDSVDEMKHCTSFEDIPASAFQGHLDMNLRAVFLLMQAFVRHFKEHAKCILNFSSMYANLCPRPSMYKNAIKNPGYPASKRGVEALSEYAAVLLGPNTRVVCIAPGGVQETIDDKDFMARYIEKVPLKRMTRFEDIRGAITYLLGASYVTGTTLVLDGGMHLT
mmetsp:Transcript_53059/g.98163  ORF Transcript_53059/g.98163 Transcript_53059/m.98163 type:complete len:273 (-) Transcript_53059:163-981(-)